MPRFWKSLFPLAALAIFACVLPGVGSFNPDTVSTSAAETVIAGLTQNVTETFTPVSTSTATMTFTPTLIYLTPRFPSETPSLTMPPGTETLTPAPTATFTLFPVEMRVTRPTHCRAGPGQAYEIVGSMLVGMKVTVIGRDPTSQYFYIPNPYVFTDYCWVWGEYAEFEGNQLLLPVVYPPPTPTSTATTVPTIDFKLNGQGMHSCDKSRWMNFLITNESNYILSSVSIVMRDTVNNVTRAVTYNNFPITTGCSGLTWMEIVSPQSAVTVSGPKFDYNIKGNKMHVTVTVCSEKDLKGVCGARETNLKP